jgi:hypothetical protein
VPLNRFWPICTERAPRYFFKSFHSFSSSKNLKDDKELQTTVQHTHTRERGRKTSLRRASEGAMSAASSKAARITCAAARFEVSAERLHDAKFHCASNPPITYLVNFFNTTPPPFLDPFD